MNRKNKFLNYIGACVEQIISFKVIIISLAIAFCICLDTWNQLSFLWTSGKGSVPVYYYIFNSFTYGGQYVPYLVPMISVALYTTNYWKESSTGMDVFIIQRLGSARKYALIKVLISCLAGGVVSVAGVSFFIIIANYFQPLYSTQLDMEANGFPYFNALKSGNGLLYFIIILYLVFLSGILWNVVALLSCIYFKNLYVTIVSPLLFSYFLKRVYTLLKVPYELRLDSWLAARSIYVSDTKTLILCTVVVLVIVSICTYVFIKKVKLQSGER